MHTERRSAGLREGRPSWRTRLAMALCAVQPPSPFRAMMAPAVLCPSGRQDTRVSDHANCFRQLVGAADGGPYISSRPPAVPLLPRFCSRLACFPEAFSSLPSLFLLLFHHFFELACLLETFNHPTLDAEPTSSGSRFSLLHRHGTPLHRLQALLICIDARFRPGKPLSLHVSHHGE